ncbi:DUF6207 family protein [Streptomyces sp. NBC_01445]|uniref:DUF6207 family protein n=1 Tax=Streptomyces sp. NBC_01445 TaxID=2903869 RepID=UPI002DD9ED42|nr:DUF6207 family protein [Streptomyces sp. NBC_01445]WSE03602.1 DUF6207 family protein [Streptomyces sp. NBC_01445]
MARPGLTEVDVVAADNRTALAFQEAIAAQWATATAEKDALRNRVPQALPLTTPRASPHGRRFCWARCFLAGHCLRLIVQTSAGV